MSGSGFRDAFRPRDTDTARKPKSTNEEVNPNVPLYMAQTPWYLASGGNASLEHQRKPVQSGKAVAGLDDWYKRGIATSTATRFRKGACENCGAMSHKTRDCLERPRKRGAKWTGKDIKPDELTENLDHLDYNYDAKRDRWNGYDPASHMAVVERFEAVEEERRRLREEALDAQASTDVNMAKRIAKKEKSHRHHDDDFDSSSSDDDDDDNEKYAEKANMVGQKMDSDKRFTIRNLRIREDRAKYLYDLNADSAAHYDPKTRSMREAPLPNTSVEELKSGSDAFERASNGPTDVKQMQMFAWQAEQRSGTMLHMQANPTDHELQFRRLSSGKSKRPRKLKVVSWKGMVELNIWIQYQQNCAQVRQKHTSSTVARVRLYEARNVPSHAHGTKKTFMKIITQVCGAHGMIWSAAFGATNAATIRCVALTARARPVKRQMQQLFYISLRGASARPIQAGQ